MIRSQSTAETGSSVAVVRACREGVYRKGAYRGEGGIGGKVGIRASFNKDAFRSFRVPLLLYRVLSVIYSGGVGE